MGVAVSSEPSPAFAFALLQELLWFRRGSRADATIVGAVGRKYPAIIVVDNYSHAGQCFSPRQFVDSLVRNQSALYLEQRNALVQKKHVVLSQAPKLC
jgi:hypothetical protein